MSAQLLPSQYRGIDVRTRSEIKARTMNPLDSHGSGIVWDSVMD
jgi:ABC-type sugar transport system ATPase subunit